MITNLFNLKKYLLLYRKLIHDGIDADNFNHSSSDLSRSKDILFIIFLQYCLPVCLIALIPGVYVSFKEDQISIAVTDLFCLLVLGILTVAKGLSLHLRKLMIVILFYSLAVFLIAKLGYIGPGIFYLLTITILISLILPTRYAYWSVLLNAIILLVFALLISSYPAGWILADKYGTGQWIAFSSNLVFVGLVVVLLIDNIFTGLQTTIHQKDKLKENYQRIFNNSPIPMWVFDTETLAFLTVNDAAIESYGYTREEFLGMTIKALRPDHYQKEIEELVLLNKGKSQVKLNNVVHLKKSGEIMYVTIDSNLLTYKGRPGKLVLATDITVQVNAETEHQKAIAKIKQSEANMQAIFKSTSDGYLLLDSSCKILAFNDNAERTIRFDKNQFPFKIGVCVFDYLKIERRNYFKEVLSRVYNGEIINYDRMFILEGIKYWISYTLTPVYEEKLVKGICITGSDITKYKNYVKTIEVQNNKLQEISWAQSHLVRAPLANIMSLTALISICSDPEERSKLLTFLEISANELDLVINNVVKRAESMPKFEDGNI